MFAALIRTKESFCLRFWIAIVLSAWLVFSSSTTAAQELSSEQLAADLDQFATELPEKHINLFAKLSQSAFEKRVAEIKQGIDGLDRITFAIELSKLLAEVGDGHTKVAFDPAQFHFFPINFKSLEDGLFVRAIEKTHRECVKGKVQSIGGVAAEQLLGKIAVVIPHDNEFALKSFIDNQLNCAELLSACGCKIEDGTTTIKIDCAGKVNAIQLTARRPNQFGSLKWEAAGDSFDSLADKKSRLDHWNDVVEPGILYFKYNRCRNGEAFERLVNGTAGYVAQNPGKIKTFVVDLRHNGGGDSRIMAPLIRYLKGNEQLNRKGRLFVITGRQTFSSAVLNTLELQEQTNAILIGEPPGGRPNHFGEIRSLSLKNSGLKIFYSTKKFVRIADSDPDFLPLDVVVPLTSKNWFAKEDPFLKAIKEFEVD
ncbi:MAG: hypothetical protein AAFN77_23270 [Planctomycetota bacterium]